MAKIVTSSSRGTYCADQARAEIPGNEWTGLAEGVGHHHFRGRRLDSHTAGIML